MSLRLFLACSAVPLFVVSAQASVIVQQVEAYTTEPGTPYAPVDFAGATTKTVSGITYHAMSATASSTYSSHADTVANRLVTYAAGAVTNIYNQYAGDWLSGKGDSYIAGGTNGYGKVAIPAVTPYGIKVVNHSWIWNPGDAASTFRYIRTIEYLTARDDLVMASGAVTDSGSSVVWGQRNGLAVRGYQTFDPASTYVGTVRKHADVWGPVSDAASFTTPQVAGISAQLVQRAITATRPDGEHHEVVKSIVMTGASKTATDGYFTSWTRDLPNNLDIHAGAGRASSTNSYAIFDAGEKSFTALSSLTSGSTISSPSISTTKEGWGYISSISELQSTAMLFHQTQQITNLTATLSWDVTPPILTGNRLDAGADELANLDLKLYSVNYSGGVYTLGSPVSGTGLSSASTDDNVEHLYYTGTLAPGYYAFVTSYVDTPSLTGYTTDAGFSYQFTPVPEPAAMGFALVCVGALLRRERKSA